MLRAPYDAFVEFPCLSPSVPIIAGYQPRLTPRERRGFDLDILTNDTMVFPLRLSNYRGSPPNFWVRLVQIQPDATAKLEFQSRTRSGHWRHQNMTEIASSIISGHSIPGSVLKQMLTNRYSSDMNTIAFPRIRSDTLPLLECGHGPQRPCSRNVDMVEHWHGDHRWPNVS